MINFTSKRIISTLMLVGFAAASNVNAAVITYSDSLGPNLTELVNETLTVSMFDDLGGTRVLNSVAVEVTGTVDARGTVTNNAANSQTFQFTETVEMFQGAATGPASLQELNLVPVFGGTVLGQQTYMRLGAGDSDVFGAYSLSGSDAFLLTDALDTAAFIGAGSFSYDFNTLIGQAFAGGGGNIAASVTTYASATLNVTYDYDTVTTTTVPEPGTIGLLGAGLLGLIGRARKRK